MDTYIVREEPSQVVKEAVLTCTITLVVIASTDSLNIYTVRCWYYYIFGEGGKGLILDNPRA